MPSSARTTIRCSSSPFSELVIPMAKKKAQPKTTAMNLNQQIAEAKDFAEMLDMMEAHVDVTIRTMEMLLRKRSKPAKASRTNWERQLRSSRVELTTLQRKREKFNALQSNRKIPSKLKKRIAELEEEIVHLEHDWGFPSAARNRKKELQEVLVQVEEILNPPKKMKTRNPAFKVKQEYTPQSVIRAYDKHVWMVLGAHFGETPRVKGQARKVVVVASLPMIEEYEEIKQKCFTKSVEALLDDAYLELSELQAEMQDAFDNMPESLQSGGVGQAREETAAQLQDVLDNTAGLPSVVSELKVVHYPKPNAKTRGQRSDEASSKIQTVVNAANELLDSSTKLRASVQKEITDFIAVLEDQINEVEMVNFPGMFG